ncbi:hypothetical protein QQP08_012156 [Theobroma cacao]|nr:hypothetical protein QQP08_012156 [Theobroma cacao]
MFSDNEGDEVFTDHDDAFMEDTVILEIDFEEVIEDVAAVVLDDPVRPKMKRASITTIEGLEKVKIDESSVKSCSMCFEDLSIGTEARHLLCSHVYHTSYITK